MLKPAPFALALSMQDRGTPTKGIAMIDKVTIRVRRAFVCSTCALAACALLGCGDSADGDVFDTGLPPDGPPSDGPPPDVIAAPDTGLPDGAPIDTAPPMDGPPRYYGEPCCVEPTVGEGCATSAGECVAGLECFVIPWGPYADNGICTHECPSEGECPAVQEVEATCLFEKCALECTEVCPAGECPPEQCPADLGCRAGFPDGSMWCLP